MSKARGTASCCIHPRGTEGAAVRSLDGRGGSMPQLLHLWMDESNWPTRPQEFGLGTSPPLLGQLGGASSSPVSPDPLINQRCWCEGLGGWGPRCPGKIKKQRQELGQAWACCLPISLGAPAGPKAWRGCKEKGPSWSRRTPMAHLLSWSISSTAKVMRKLGSSGEVFRSRRSIL